MENYCIIFTQTLKQWNVSETFRRALPKGKGEVFYPCIEMWWHGKEKTVFKPLFPGYVFIRSPLERDELHEYVKQAGKQILSFVKELKISDEPDVMLLSDEEAEFFDFLLGFKYDAKLDERVEAARQQGQTYKPVHVCDEKEEHSDTDDMLTPSERLALAELKRRQKKVPENGVVQMSFGYKEDGRFVVMDGPLKGHEDRICQYNSKDKKAYLNIKLAGKPVKVGLMLLGKRVWFPEDKNAPDILSDGTVLDIKKLSRLMSGGGK